APCCIFLTELRLPAGSARQFQECVIESGAAKLDAVDVSLEVSCQGRDEAGSVVHLDPNTIATGFG
ncbi:MAG: hypothetical protein WB239_05100, partial [Acidimicrobiia bacterium]